MSQIMQSTSVSVEVGKKLLLSSNTNTILPVQQEIEEEPPNKMKKIRKQSKFKNLYECSECPKKFTRLYYFRNHMRLHNGEIPHECEICKKPFLKLANMQVHYRTHANFRPFACELCPKTFHQKAHLEGHLRTHTGERPYECEICRKTFAHKSYLKVHSAMHRGIPTTRRSSIPQSKHKCPICNKMFLYKKTLEIHMAEEEMFLSKKNAKTHLGADSKEKLLLFDCEKCSKSFTSLWNLQRHVKRTHESVKKARERCKCGICGKTFAWFSGLKYHSRVHTGEKTHIREKPHTCEKCGKSFSNANHMQTHLRTHSKEKPYECQICSKKFSQTSHLKTHMRLHSAIKPYHCPQCERTFYQSCHLKSHLVTHTKQKLCERTKNSKTSSSNVCLEQNLIAPEDIKTENSTIPSN